MNMTLVKNLPLENGLYLEVFDRSRPVAGDRWLVSAMLRIVIPLEKLDFDSLTVNTEELKMLLGPTVTYEREESRNFIDEDEKDTLFQSLLDSLLDSTFKYLGHKDFPKRFVFRKYLEEKKKTTWYTEAVD